MTDQDSSFNKNAPKECTEVETGDLSYGYEYFPERRDSEQKKGFWEQLTAGRAYGRKLRCYSNVQWCLKNSEYRLYNSIIFCGALV